MSGIELGVGFISVVPTTEKIAPGIKKALTDAQKDVKASGKAMGATIGAELTGSLKGYGADAKAAGKTAGENIGSGIKTALKSAVADSQTAGKSIGENIGGGVTKALKASETQSKTSGKVIGKNLKGGITDGVTKSGGRGLFGAIGREAVSAGRGIGTTIGSGIQSGVSRIAPTITSILTAAVVGAGGLGFFGVKVAAGFEQTEIAFGTLLKSSERAKKEMAWLKVKSAATPFELKDLADADKTLLNFGFTSDGVRQQFLLDMGNIAAAVGLPGNRLADLAKVFGQVKAAGVAQLDDVNQLIDAGVPVWDALTKSTGKSVQQLRDDISKGKLTSDIFLKSLQGYSKLNFGTAMDKQGKSITGMWSSITDNFSLGAAKLVQPLLPFVSSIMPKASVAMATVGDKVAVLIPKAINLGKSFKENVLPGILTVGNTIKNVLLPPLVKMGEFITTHLPLIAGLAVGIGAIVVGVKGWMLAVRAFTAIQGLYNGVLAFQAVAAGTATEAQIALNAAMSANVIGLIVLGLAALVLGIVYAYKHFEGFRNLVNAVWAGIQTAISFAWNNVIKPVFAALSWYVTTILIPVIKGYWTVISTVFGFIGSYIKGIWDRLLYPIFQFWAWVIVNVVVPPLVMLWEKVIRPVFGAIGNFIGDTYTKKIKPVLLAIGNIITDTVVPAFKKGVSALGTVWDGLRASFLAPVNFMIGTVYNDGIRKLINALPGVTDVPPLGLIGQPKAASRGGVGGGHAIFGSGFAAGGAVRGFGRKGIDSIRAMLAPGEHVWTAKEVDAAGGQGAMYAMRKAILRNGGMGQSFDPPAFAAGGTLSDAAIKRAKAFAMAHEGDPYGWGSVGPNSFDCSGLMSAITNIVRGANPFSRVGATGNFPWSGFEPGPGQFTIGSTKNYGGSGIGHMAGTLDGMNVESRGGRGVITGPSARGYNDAGFNTVAHLGAGGTDGGFLASIKDVLANLKGWVSELASMGGFGGLVKQMVQGVGAELKNFINGKVPGPGPLNGGIFDNGGILEPGAVAFNASKKPEAVFNQRQFANVLSNNGSEAGNRTSRMELVLDNGERLSGYVRNIANQEIDGASDYAASTNRRNR